MNITEKEAKALAMWAKAVTTSWGRDFDAAFAVAERVARALKNRKPAPPRGRAPKPGWK